MASITLFLVTETRRTKKSGTVLKERVVLCLDSLIPPCQKREWGGLPCPYLSCGHLTSRHLRILRTDTVGPRDLEGICSLLLLFSVLTIIPKDLSALSKQSPQVTSLTKKVIAVSSYWGRENYSSLKMWLLIGWPCSSGWPMHYRHLVDYCFKKWRRRRALGSLALKFSKPERYTLRERTIKVRENINSNHY